MKTIFGAVLFLTILALQSAVSQEVPVSGILRDSASHAAIPGATIRLIYTLDSTINRGTISDAKGNFTIVAPKEGGYRLIVMLIGYRELHRKIVARPPGLQLGTLSLVQKPVVLSGVDVNAEMPTVEQKKDTIQLNAGAFKTNKDANAQDLVTKMPGITVDKSSVKAGGEDVKQVLVDGRQFFGDDPLIALRNLPADMIDKIQVYDKLSDQAELTGFDDGNSTKTMNIITRANRRNGQFGKAYGGYGDDTRYQTGGNLNVFNGDMRLSVLGLSNNVNQQNFSPQDFLGMSGGQSRLGAMGSAMFRGGGTRGGGGGMRGGGGPGALAAFQLGNLSDFVVGQQSGINTTHSGGLNFSNTWSDAMKVTGSYFITYGDNKNDQSLHRQYFLTTPDDQFYNEHNTTDGNSTNNRLNLRMEYTMDSTNALIFTPRVSFQSTRNTNGILGANYFGADSILNQRSTTSLADGNGYNLASGATYRHKFATPGRTISLDLNLGGNVKNSTSGLGSINGTYLTGLPAFDTLNQQGSNNSNGRSISGNLSYTEPLGTNSLLQWNYMLSYNRNTANKYSYDLDSLTGGYDLLNNRLSTVLDNDYRTDRAGIGYRGRGTNYNLVAGIGIQRARLSGSYTLPAITSVDKDFTSLIPMMLLTYRLSTSNTLIFRYMVQTAAPSVSQLQNAVDNSNPTMLTSGNPDLRQSTTHTLFARYSSANLANSTSFFAMLNAGFTNDYIGTATYLYDVDTVLANGTPLSRGTQFSQSVNLGGYRNLNSFFVYGFPIGFMKSNLNLTAGLGYASTPGLINGGWNAARNYSVTQGVVLGSNISQDVDFTLSYNYTLGIVRNTANPELNTTSFQHTAGCRFSLTMWESFVVRNDLSHQLYAGYGSSANQGIILWNLTLAKKFLSDGSLELALTGNDLFNQNNKVIRNVTTSYFEDVIPQVLTRYYLLTLTYTVRNSAPAPDRPFFPRD